MEAPVSTSIGRSAPSIHTVTTNGLEGELVTLNRVYPEATTSCAVVLGVSTE